MQIHRKYTAADFDEDLRFVLRRAGCKNEKIVFILDESNILESGFLERMNTLLANGEASHVLLLTGGGGGSTHQHFSHARARKGRARLRSGQLLHARTLASRF